MHADENGRPRPSSPVMDDAARDEIALDVAGFAPDVATVDALARLQLAARRSGRRLRLTSIPVDLRRLIELCGLADALLADGAASPGAAEALSD